ncbi:type VI secretion system tip protein VgrG [Gilliamella sp. B2840]|uniref:type VI secretion system Vgr family protein n=1 Tax=unclassified Gilliamella TaxID=2685620 RepID=UPI00226A81EF|nr:MULTISPECIES: type VI secretion system Vgr family protein [unclassified Gilliamella]MCX8664047.1 type VI secretion system tip protein VgrG [Gilliamella sp. B2887]MCX8698085.1 type VI secretion system tip protein VgrG [Gilliamella sp. B3000]MCX8699725.1 type VI secretion system tip protein VgrG [Gilliamella sp. B2840]
MNSMESIVNNISSFINNSSLNNYSLNIEGLNNELTLPSIESIKGNEALNIPWHYNIIFTCPNKHIEIDSVLSQHASLTFQTHNLANTLTHLTSYNLNQKPKTLHGIITQFSLLSINKDEARYQVTLEPRLALLANSYHCAIYQNQSVVAVVEEVLRNHHFIGIDYRFELKETYPEREFITQWQESDLTFIQRLLADVGIWFRFETHPEHYCDVMVISDDQQGFADGGTISLKTPSGMHDDHQNSVWDLQFTSHTKPQNVIVNDYNYRSADSDLNTQINTQPKDITTRGDDYHYEEHYKLRGDERTIESGQWYAQIRHQQYISGKLIISGKCNDYNLAPGQHIIIPQCPINDIHNGIIILSTQNYGDRTYPYQTHFTAIAYDELKPYRPTPLPWPQVSGTLPAKVTSPDNDTYAYIDIQGRYRVKFNFDLKNWKNGYESLWVRLAKPYAGETYGFHFPLIDSTAVAIAFTNGNPDRPYIAHAMHDSMHPDHIATANKHRNVIRTPANNKLRMDDKRGQEHIKLSTEYGKTQLNLGHLVDGEKNQRGEGFELRTDEWGAIRAGKGVFITADEQSKAQNIQLNMQEAKEQLEKTVNMVSALQSAAKQAEAELADLESQKKLFTQSLAELKQASILLSSPKGIAQVTPDNIQLAAGKNIMFASHQHTDINVLRKFTVAAGEIISLFSQKLGIKLLASHGKVDIQAQSDEMSLTAQKDLTMVSQQGRTIISAKKELILTCGGAYIRLADGSIDIAAPDNVICRAATWQKTGPDSLSQMSNEQKTSNYSFKSRLLWQHDGTPVKNRKVRIIRADNSEINTITDENGKLPEQFGQFIEPITVVIEPENKI